MEIRPPSSRCIASFRRAFAFISAASLDRRISTDKVHDVFLIIVQSIQKGELREPERLMGYVRTIVRRQVAAQIDDNVKARRNQADLEFGMAFPTAIPIRNAAPSSTRTESWPCAS